MTKEIRKYSELKHNKNTTYELCEMQLTVIRGKFIVLMPMLVKRKRLNDLNFHFELQKED